MAADNFFKELEKIPNECVFFNFKKAYLKVSKIFDTAFSDSDITANQFTMLNSLFLLQKPVSINKLSKILSIDRTTLTRNLKILFKNNLAQIQSPDEDLRKKLVSITETGKKMLEKELDTWKESQKAVENQLGDKELTNLLKTLNSIENLKIPNK
jgi:DNA-binding MarR family transcriptional regulator